MVGRRSEFVSLVDIQHHRCRERTYLILLLMQNTVSLFSSVRGRQPQGDPMREQVKECGKSEGRSVMERTEVATSPPVKAGRLPRGLSPREPLTKRQKKGKADDGSIPC